MLRELSNKIFQKSQEVIVENKKMTKFRCMIRRKFSQRKFWVKPSIAFLFDIFSNFKSYS